MEYGLLGHRDMKATNLMRRGVSIALIDLNFSRIFENKSGWSMSFKKDIDRSGRNWSAEKINLGVLFPHA